MISKKMIFLVFCKVFSLIVLDTIIFVLLYNQSFSVTLVSPYSVYCLKCHSTTSECAVPEIHECVLEAIYGDAFLVGTNYLVVYVGALFIHFTILYTFNVEYREKSLHLKTFLNIVITAFTALEFIMVVMLFTAYDNLLQSLNTTISEYVDQNFLDNFFNYVYSLLISVSSIQYIFKMLTIIFSSIIYYKFETTNKDGEHEHV